MVEEKINKFKTVSAQTNTKQSMKRKTAKEMLFEEIPLRLSKQWKDNVPLLNLAAVETNLLSWGLYVYYIQIHTATHILLSTNDHHHPHGQKFRE